jgi:cell wall assembly regulator SMI1
MPTQPAAVAKINAAWQKIETWLRKNARPAFDQLPRRATEAQLKAAEKALKHRLDGPLQAELRACYLRHNGSGQLPLFPSSESEDMGFALIPLEELPEEAEAWADSSIDDADVTNARGIKRLLWGRRWIAFARNGFGDYQLLDLDPAKGGQVGQVIEANHETLERKKRAPSLLKFLESIAGGLKSGTLVYDPERGVMRPSKVEPPKPEELIAKAEEILARAYDLPPGQGPEPGGYVDRLGYPDIVEAFGKEHFRHPPAQLNAIWSNLPSHAALWSYFYSNYDPLPSAKRHGVRLLGIREMIEKSGPIILSAYAYIVAEADDDHSCYADHLGAPLDPKVAIRRIQTPLLATAIAERWDDKKLRAHSERVAHDIADLVRKLSMDSIAW